MIRALQPGKIAQAGTYSGNGLSVAAAHATIGELTSGPALATIAKRGEALMDGIGSVLADRGIAHHIVGVPAMFGIHFSEDRPTEFRHTANHDAETYEAIGMGMIRRGVFPEADGLEPWFLSAALSEEDVATTLTAFEEAVAEAT